mmetsp:Transcript_137646/g.439760  ORF Transcript_137646/g.439760 Transcript_137646/m.439760 type:complete len:208 (-) Transcript_137646:19-642(-)
MKIYSAERETVPNLFSERNKRCYDRNRACMTSFAPYVWGLLHALVKLPPYTEHTVVRGVKLNLQSHSLEGKIVTWWGCSSCTESTKVLETAKFCGKTGDRTIFINTLTQGIAQDIMQYSLVPSEKEILLPFGSTFRVTANSDAGHGLCTVMLKEIAPADVLLDLCTSPAGRQGPLPRQRDLLQIGPTSGSLAAGLSRESPAVQRTAS